MLGWFLTVAPPGSCGTGRKTLWSSAHQPSELTNSCSFWLEPFIGIYKRPGTISTEVVKWLWPSKPKANKKSVFTGLKIVDGQTLNFKTTKENSFTVFLNMREMFTLATVRPLVFIVLLL